jgi:putative endonuclease
MMSDIKKKLWYESEKIAAEYYKSKWYNIVAKNYTIPWWEIDIIVEDNQNLIFVEVKTINAIDDIDGYVTKKKIWFLNNAVQTYLMKNSTDKDISIDAVFVKWNQIVEIYQNITNN